MSPGRAGGPGDGPPRGGRVRVQSRAAMTQRRIVFRLEGSRQACRTRQVGEQHRHEVTLGPEHCAGCFGMALRGANLRRLRSHAPMVDDR